MRAIVRAALGTAAVAGGVFLFSTDGSAHKPITSPYTFNEDVFPIVNERCGACHVIGGVGPMSLLTHRDAVPWGESLRAELMAGHMPPWRVDSSPARFRNVQGLTGRELNVLMTWASGGTPIGDPEKTPPAVSVRRDWPLGTPDVVLPLPNDVTLGPDVQERTAEFTIATGFSEGRWLRAADLLPGTPALVRSATIAVTGAAATPGASDETLLALWLPGDHPFPLDRGAAFYLPAGSTLVVRVRYRKTWENENRTMTDRSSIGLYLAELPATALRALPLAPGGTSGALDSIGFGTVLTEPLRAVAIYPDPGLANAAITVTAIRPDTSREELIAFRPQAGWARRYWFREAIALPRGTRIDVQVKRADPLLPPGALPPPMPTDPPRLRLTLNALPAS